MSKPDTDGALTIKPLEDCEVAEVIALWHRCGSTRPCNDPAADIALARRGENSTVLIGKCERALVASVMVGHDGHRGWVYYVTVDPDRRHHGFGRSIMDAAEAWLRARGIAKLQLMVLPIDRLLQPGNRDFCQMARRPRTDAVALASKGIS